jgi:ubiquinone/menaquinone biosynthesis C-methylase UbiE
MEWKTEVQSVEVSPIEADGFILDLGGGGEGIIGKLNGNQVVAIDTRKEELMETHNQALKVVMDAADLMFLPKSFDVCTAFFSLMYMPKKIHRKVFEEVSQVLKDNGRFLVWDVRIPESVAAYRTFYLDLKVRLPNEEVKTGYGVRCQAQSLEYFRELARSTGFEVVKESHKDETFYLEMRKQV